MSISNTVRGLTESPKYLQEVSSTQGRERQLTSRSEDEWHLSSRRKIAAALLSQVFELVADSICPASERKQARALAGNTITIQDFQISDLEGWICRTRELKPRKVW